MIKPIRIGASLGDPPKQYHNNSPECINNVIKMKVRREKSSLDEFCSEMKSLVEQQQNHLIRAITCRGEYRLHSCFREYEMDPSKWFQLNEISRTAHIQRLRTAAFKYMGKLAHQEQGKMPNPSAAVNITSLCSSQTNDTESTLTTAAESQEPDNNVKEIRLTSDIPLPNTSPIEREKFHTIDHSLYVPITGNTTVSQSTIQNILQKAEDLLASPNAITAAPVEGMMTRMVKSKSNPCRPHLVQVHTNGKVVCDENCLMWTTIKICSHCVAVAHCLDCTSEYISWFIANSNINLTKITTSGVGRNVGKKPSQNRYSQRKNKVPVVSRIPHSSFTSSEQATALEPPSFDNTSPFQAPHPLTSTFNTPFVTWSDKTSLIAIKVLS